MGKRLKSRGVVEVRVNYAGELTRETKINGTVTMANAYSSNHDSNQLHNGNMQIKGAGNSTWNNPQKPFNLTIALPDFKKKAGPWWGMQNGSDYRFLMDFFDGSKSKNMLAMDLADDLGVTWASDMRKAELYVNDSYYGLVTIAEKVDKSANKANIATGDFLIEHQQVSQMSAEEGKFQDDVLGKGHSFKEPDLLLGVPADEVKIAAAKARINALYNAIMNGTDAEALAAIDVPSWQRGGILQDLIKNPDGFYGSMYLRVLAGNTKVFLDPPWDFDSSFGAVPYVSWAGLNINYSKPNDTYLAQKSPLFGRLMQIPSFREGVAEMFKIALPKIHQTLVDYDAFIEALEATGAPARNRALWGGEDYRTGPTNGADHVRAFIRRRLYFHTRGVYDIIPPKAIS